MAALLEMSDGNPLIPAGRGAGRSMTCP